MENAQTAWSARSCLLSDKTAVSFRFYHTGERSYSRGRTRPTTGPFHCARGERVRTLLLGSGNQVRNDGYDERIGGCRTRSFDDGTTDPKRAAQAGVRVGTIVLQAEHQRSLERRHGF